MRFLLLNLFLFNISVMAQELPFSSITQSPENYTAINDRFQYMKPHQHLPESDFASVHYISFDNKVHKSTSFINQNTFS